ncbi:cysteine desulfurase, partial [Coemansia sp. S85]
SIFGLRTMFSRTLRTLGARAAASTSRIATAANLTRTQGLSTTTRLGATAAEAVTNHNKPTGSTDLEKNTMPIYLDAQATTPLDPRVLDAMMPYMTESYGNPHSRTHKYGWETEQAVDKAREQIASLIGAHPKEIIFTSGATEANNTAIKGVARFYKGKKNHIITAQTEHKCVLDSCRVLQEEGFEVTYLP